LFFIFAFGFNSDKDVNFQIISLFRANGSILFTMINFKEELNNSQFRAVQKIDGPMLVIAGAGSGKTRVIEYRVLNLIEKEIAPEAILLLTFTRRAANEMLARAARHNALCARVDGGTFHSFAYKILKHYGERILIPRNFSVIDQGDAENAIQKCALSLGFGGKGDKKFPKKDTLLGIISASINKELSLEEIILDEYPHFLELVSKIEAVKDGFQKYKREMGYLDYDDLLVFLKKILRDDLIREKLTQKYKYIMVDEYQDTNLLQGDIVYLLAIGHKNIMIVGDDAQSIYGFRGARHENIMQFPDRFENCEIIKLEENYRSTQAILDMANVVLKNMEVRFEKKLRAATKQATGEKPQFTYFKNPYEEVEWIADKMEELKNRGVKFKEQAALFRATYVSIPLQAELTRRNIPFDVFGGLKFYETAHIRDVLAHLRVLENPKDELAWVRILTLIDGVGEKTAEKIIAEIKQYNEWSRMIQILKTEMNELSEMFSVTNNKQQMINDKERVSDILEVVLNYYKPIFREKFDDWRTRINDFEVIKQMSERYDSLEQMLADFVIDSPHKQIAWGTNKEDDKLTLSTIHSAKGLEWGAVYLIGAIDGVLPSNMTLDNDDEIEEEHRLFYVAVTRAKKHLFLSMHKMGRNMGVTQFNAPSRFVSAPNVLEKLEIGGMATRKEIARWGDEDGIENY